jgi:hypothetical protein
VKQGPYAGDSDKTTFASDDQVDRRFGPNSGKS